MSSPPPFSGKVIELTAHPQPFPFSPIHYFAESWWSCWKPKSSSTELKRCDALLSTGHDFSVIPFRVQRMLRPVILPEPSWIGDIPLWFGSECNVGRAELRLPVQPGLGLRYWLFSLLVLLPIKRSRYDPPYILLASQFLHENRAEVRLHPAGGQLLVP